MSDDNSLFVRQFEAAEEASQPGRRESEQARDYYDGNQLTEDEKKTLRRRKQPIVIENLVRPKVDGLCGLERQSRTDPKAWPRTMAHEEEANAATDALRYVADDQDIDIKRSAVFQNMLVEGYGGVEVGVHRSRNQIDPKVTRIEWERIYYDPHSRAADFSDAAYLGYVTWMDQTEAVERWPDAKDVITATMERGTSESFETYDDKPRWSYWSDGKRKRVRINTHYFRRSGVWHRVVFTLAGAVEAAAPCPFIDEDGNPECPLILQSAFVDRDNDRYGIVRDFITLQDEVNKRRSKFLHIVNNRQVRVSPSGGMDAEAVRRELSKPDGVIMGENGDVEVLGMGDMAAGQFQLLADTRATLKGNIGPNATMQGKQGEGQSGRAIMALQQAGMTEMAPLLDNLRHFTLRLYRQVWNRIRQYWTAERWIRVTDDERNVRFVGINVPRGNLAMTKVAEALRSGQIDEPTARQYEAQIHSDPAMQQPANVIAELDVDIEIDEVNNTPTLQAEQFEQLVQLAGTDMVPIPPEMIIAASTLRDKQKLLTILEEQKAQPNPMQEMEMAGAQAKIEETQSRSAKNMADAQATVAGVRLDALSAGMQAGMAA